MNWLAERWPDVIVPLVAVLAGLIVTLWLRRRAYKALDKWAKKTKWKGDDMLVQATRHPSILWCIAISAYLAVAVSTLSSTWRTRAGNGLWTILVISLAISAVDLMTKLIAFYGERFKTPERALIVCNNIARAIIVVVATLALLDIWGVPTSAILLLAVLVVLILALSLRDALPNLFATLQLNARPHVKIGDYIKLESGEEGMVREMGWESTRIEQAGGGFVSVPNRKLIQSTLINYGLPLKKAKEPFRFMNRVYLRELTGLKASNLRELANILKDVPDSVVYYHTHIFVEEHDFLVPEPANEFALWVSNTIDDKILGERLAAIDNSEFSTMGALRDRLVSMIEEHLNLVVRPEDALRNAPNGMEFHFVKAVSVILPTDYVAHDLREFVEVLRKLSQGSLYFHLFESRLRLGRGRNDFSTWLEDDLGEKELAAQVARLDPYNYTLEGLRSALIQLTEKRILT